jgi:hypothetical protein
MSGPVIYANTQTGMMSTQPFPPFPGLSLSPSAVSDFSLNDCLGGIGEMFPSSSSWDNYDTNSQESQHQTQGTGTTTSAATTLHNSTTVNSNAYATPPAGGAHQTSPLCASQSPSVANLVRSPSNPSPQSVPAQHNYAQNTCAFDTDFSPSSVGSATGGGGQSSATQKLRNLLTQGSFMSDEADSSPIIKKEPGLQNDILRELLEEDDGPDPMPSSVGPSADTPQAPPSVPPPSTPYSENSCPGSVGSDKKVANNNNMLRMLLNDDEIGSKRADIRKNHELVEQYLLKDNGDHNRDSLSGLIAHLKKEPIDSQRNYHRFCTTLSDVEDTV